MTRLGVEIKSLIDLKKMSKDELLNILKEATAEIYLSNLLALSVNKNCPDMKLFNPDKIISGDTNIINVAYNYISSECKNMVINNLFFVIELERNLIDYKGNELMPDIQVYKDGHYEIIFYAEQKGRTFFEPSTFYESKPVK